MMEKQIAEALAPLQSELAVARARIAELEAEADGLERRCRELRGVCMQAHSLLVGEGEAYANADDILPRIVALQSEVAALRAAAAPEPDGIDLSAAIYRDALADFAIRVLSGGVAVSFREPRP